MTISSTKTFDISPIKGWIVDNTGPTYSINPSVNVVEYNGATGITPSYLTASTTTYIMLDRDGVINQQNTYPTPSEKRTMIYIGKVSHANKSTIQQIFLEPIIDASPLSQLRDMFTPIHFINDGVYPYPNGSNLSFNLTSGKIWGMGIGYIYDELNPNSIDINSAEPTPFQYRTQIIGTNSTVTEVDPTNYDNGGTITAVGSPGKQSTNQRIYISQNGSIRVQYGQTVYSDLNTAISNIQRESFVTFPNFKDNAILIGILSISADCTSLEDTSKSRFFLVSKFGETIGSAGGVSTATIQTAYENSNIPQLTTSTTLGELSIKRGSDSDDDNIFAGLDGDNNINFAITGSGSVTLKNLTTTGITYGVLYSNLSGEISSIQRITGTISGLSFSGATLSYTVSLESTFNSDYIVNIESSVPRMFTINDKTSNSFVINSNSTDSFNSNIYWQALSL